MKLRKYKHSKTGNFYNVTAMALHSETEEELVIYECLYNNPKSKVWVRPKTMFQEQIIINGKRIPRFEFIEE